MSAKNPESKEFPQYAEIWPQDVSRRKFLQIMGATLALTGFNSCVRQPDEEIVPYVDPPEIGLPGESLFFATAIMHGGYGTGVLVENHQGRPTRIEGNPDHPENQGSVDIFSQAAILDLYDPNRSKRITKNDRLQTWSDFSAQLKAKLDKLKFPEGEGIRIFSGTNTSPTLVDQFVLFKALYPRAKWYQYEPVNRDNIKKGSQMAFGRVVDMSYRFDKAAIILALDGDFLSHMPGHLANARGFAAKRNPEKNNQQISRLYVLESTPSTAGGMADHRLRLRPHEIEIFMVRLARELGIPVKHSSAEIPAKAQTWIKPLAKDLKSHQGKSLVVLGFHHPAWVHALVHAINHHLGNIGNTMDYHQPADPFDALQSNSLAELTGEMESGKVELCIFMNNNPVYETPADCNFAAQLAKVDMSVYLGLENNETAQLCQWNIPMAHQLESWGDIRSFDGTVTIQQPLIAPLYGGKTLHDILAILVNDPGRTAYQMIREYWSDILGEGNFEKRWRKALHDGLIPDTASPQVQVELNEELPVPQNHEIQGLDVLFRPHPTVWDGKFANNAWLQELPDPVTKLTWENAALVSPATAERFHWKNGDLVELQYQGRKVQAPIWTLPGHVDQAATIHFGYGRTSTGPVGKGIGFNAFHLQTMAVNWNGYGLEIRKTGKSTVLACTQDHQSMEGRDLVREESVYQLSVFPKENHHEKQPLPSLYAERKYDKNSWGMVIDLNACHGCGICTIACQSENNIATVGKEQVLLGREMHWLRIDRYFSGSLDDPRMVVQPVPCMHCEKATCEPVCPVGATVHSDEGLNEMVYNRCVGTRYCSNNCPYKVRRFNFLQYADRQDNAAQWKLLQNPDVTVRSRGVMEKCTYCVQRINQARITAKKENRSIQDGEVMTACQAACPTQAITFGNLNDKKSKVAKAKQNKRNYVILEELNTGPRTSYMTKLRNPNPEIG